MTQRERSVESLIGEHKKFRKQCQNRIRPALMLSGVVTVILGYVIWHFPNGWKVGVPIIAFSYIYTVMEIICFYKHSKAIEKFESSL